MKPIILAAAAALFGCAAQAQTYHDTGGTVVPGIVPLVNPVGTANFAPNQVSCTSSATPVAAARSGSPGTGRIAILVEQLGTVNVYLGGSGVTTSTGFLLPGVVGATVTLPITSALYCITSGTSQSVAFTELY